MKQLPEGKQNHSSKKKTQKKPWLVEVGVGGAYSGLSQGWGLGGD